MEHYQKFPKLSIILLLPSLVFLVLIIFNYQYQNLPPENLEEIPKVHNNSEKTPSTSLEKVQKIYNNSEKKQCDLFRGEWVRSLEGPYYTNKTCQRIQYHQNCMKNGKPGDEYLKWRWRPSELGCDLPLFDPIQFFKIVRGKSLAFVGDSVARNQMQSLLCMLSVFESPIDASETKDEGSEFKRYEYKTHNFTVEMFWSPYLVRTTQTNPKDKFQPFNLYLDEFDTKWTAKIKSFDYIIISAAQWFNRPMMFHINNQLIGCLWCARKDITQFGVDFGFEMAYKTAFQAINSLESYKGIIFVRTFATSHFENGYWNTGGNCIKTRPYMSNESHVDAEKIDFYKIQIKQFKNAVRVGNKKGLRFKLFDITRAMIMRPDGHPGHYGKGNPKWPNDCIHWCLPGPIDTWNEFLLEMLKSEEKKT